jgi:hypothetical protein
MDRWADGKKDRWTNGQDIYRAAKMNGTYREMDTGIGHLEKWTY